VRLVAHLLPRPLALALLLVIVGGPLASAAGAGPELSLARFVASATATATVTATTLDPPTGLAATGGGSVGLSWTASVDPWAAGYDVQRATVSGGPYAVISTVTPGTTVATTDTPASGGTYYYVLRSEFQSWTSVNTAEVSAVFTPGVVSTGYLPCTAASNAADTGGDGDGYESAPGNACANDNAVATDASSGTNTTLSCTDAGKDRHRWWDFNLGVPATASSINGIQVRTDVGQNNSAGTAQICVQLSWDGGTSWTAAKSATLTSNGAVTYILGAVNDTWGRTWSGANFSNANFRVRVIDASDRSNKDFRLDFLAVQVSYAP
jgi:hypothetical protein